MRVEELWSSPASLATVDALWLLDAGELDRVAAWTVEDWITVLDPALPVAELDTAATGMRQQPAAGRAWLVVALLAACSARVDVAEQVATQAWMAERFSTAGVVVGCAARLAHDALYAHEWTPTHDALWRVLRAAAEHAGSSDADDRMAARAFTELDTMLCEAALDGRLTCGVDDPAVNGIAAGLSAQLGDLGPLVGANPKLAAELVHDVSSARAFVAALAVRGHVPGEVAQTLERRARRWPLDVWAAFAFYTLAGGKSATSFTYLEPERLAALIEYASAPPGSLAGGRSRLRTVVRTCLESACPIDTFAVLPADVVHAVLDASDGAAAATAAKLTQLCGAEHVDTALALLGTWSGTIGELVGAVELIRAGSGTVEVPS